MEKIENYLLSSTHILGRYKARFFFKLGYTPLHAKRLADDLLQIARNNPVVSQHQTPFGTKFVVDGEISSPFNITARIRTVWIIDAGEEIPRLVTAYPLE